MNEKPQSKAIAVAVVVANVIRSLKEVPSGHLYAQVMDRMGIHEYNSTISLLKESKLITEEHHVLRWIGPT